MKLSHEEYFREAGKVAEGSLCDRAKCGSIIVHESVIVGRGYNAPPEDNVSQKRCLDTYSDNPRKPKSDRTCCTHAEWRALFDALKHRGDITGSTLYFTRVDEAGTLLRSGEPYCTVCSRLARESGVACFALWHDDGIQLYDTKEYDDLSYAFHTQ